MSPDIRPVRVRSSPQQTQRCRRIAEHGQNGLFTHCLTMALEINGLVVPSTLQTALDAVVAGRPALRAVFPGPDSEHLIQPAMPVRLARVLVTGAEPAERWAEAMRLAMADRMQPFDLARGPLIRATLLTAERERHMLVLSMDQLVTDARSAALVVEELVGRTHALITGSPVADERPDHYVEVFANRDEWSDGARGRAALERRDAEMAGVSPILPWIPRPDHRGSDALAHHTVVLEDQVGTGLREAARSLRVIPFALALTAFRLLLPQADVPRSVTSMFANRGEPIEADVVGWLSNRVPVPLPDVDGTLRDSVRSAHRRLMRSLTAERLPWTPPSTSDSVTASILYLSPELSGGAQVDLRMGQASVRRLAVSFCPTGADVDLFVVEGVALLTGASAGVAVGGTSVRDRVGQEQLVDLVEQWAESLERVVQSDPDSPMTTVLDRTVTR